MSVAEMSFLGSAVILAVLLIRAAGLYRLPRQTFVVLWDVAAVRLLIPWALPAATSLYALFAVPEVPAATVVPTTAAPVVGADGAAVSAQAVPVPVNWWLLIWLAGALVTAAVFAVLYVRWLRRFAASLPVNRKEVQDWLAAHPLRRPLQIRQSDCISAPLTYGVLRPVILLPKTAQSLTGEDLSYVLTHEYVHIRRFDALNKLLLIAAVCVHWFNPLVWIMYILANRDLELSCDEAVLQRLGSRAGYARLLIRLEEQRLALTPFCSSCSGNALQERIRSIVKMKKHTVLAVVLAAVLVIGVSTALATSPPAPQEETAVISQELISRTEPDGTTSYSFDGGRTFTALTDQELEEQMGVPDVEWWTAEEYEAWITEQKAALQEMLGSKAWTNADGEFVWTQEKIDETIAAYEDTLAQIRRGLRISKTVDGSDDIMLMSGSEDYSPLFDEYARFGLTADDEGQLFYQGEKVGYFEDRVEIEPGMSASRYSVYSPEGTVHLRTVRKAAQNPDGSTDPFGELIGLGRIPDHEAERLIRDYQSTGLSGAVAAYDETEVQALEAASAEQEEELQRILEPYAAFGLTWEMDPQAELCMHWHGRIVHCLYDEATGVWIAKNMNGSDLLDSSAVHVEAVYKDGRLTGLRECQPPHPNIVESTELSRAAQLTETAVVQSSAEEQGTPFETVFARYAPLGLSFRTMQSGGSVGYNLFYQGKPVNHFADVSGSGVFTFDSANQVPDGVSAFVVYENGKAVGITVE